MTRDCARITDGQYCGRPYTTTRDIEASATELQYRIDLCAEHAAEMDCPTYTAAAPHNEIGLWQVTTEGPGYSNAELEARWASGCIEAWDPCDLTAGPRYGVRRLPG